MNVTLRDLIEQLEDIAEEHGDDTCVRLAMQPSWPFEYSIGDVVVVKQRERRDCSKRTAVCYIGEGQQLAYLSGAAATALDWRHGDSDDDDDDDTPCDCPRCQRGGGSPDAPTK